VCVWERDSVWKRVREWGVCVCVFKRVWERDCVFVSLRVKKRWNNFFCFHQISWQSFSWIIFFSLSLIILDWRVSQSEIFHLKNNLSGLTCYGFCGKQRLILIFTGFPKNDINGTIWMFQCCQMIINFPEVPQLEEARLKNTSLIR